MANPTTNYGWVMPTATDLVTDLPADFNVFGQAVDTSLAQLKGGTTGQVLSKTSATDMAFTWVAQDDSNAIQNTIVDAKGDLIGATAADTPARLAVGTNGQVLTADSTAGTGLKWSTVSSGLSLITTQGFSASASLSINNCFSATYTNYRIIFYLTDASTQTNINARLRVGGTDATAANYNKTGTLTYSTTLTYDNSAGDTSWAFSAMNTDASGLCTEGVSCDIYRPFLANRTAATLQAVQNVDTGRTRNLVHTLKTSYDGITFTPISGNMTGSVSIYGYAI